VPPHVESVSKALTYQPVGIFPRGELFLGRDFLDRFFGHYRGDKIKQLEAAARLLGLSVIGIELNPGKSLSGDDQRRVQALVPYFKVGYFNGPISGLIAQEGFLKAMSSTKKKPSLLSGMATTLLNYTETVARLAKKSDLQALAIADDIAGNQGLFFPVTYFQEEVWPVYKQMVEIIKGKGLLAFFHSDGDIRKIIPLLIEAGIDCLHPVDTQAGQNLYALKRDFGERVGFMGHIDLLTWSPEQVKQEMALAEKEFQNGGLILGSNCGLSMATVNDNLGILYPGWKSVGN
jgi:uroporphyrinogen decarboxylase